MTDYLKRAAICNESAMACIAETTNFLRAQNYMAAQASAESARDFLAEIQKMIDDGHVSAGEVELLINMSDGEYNAHKAQIAPMEEAIERLSQKEPVAGTVLTPLLEAFKLFVALGRANP